MRANKVKEIIKDGFSKLNETIIADLMNYVKKPSNGELNRIWRDGIVHFGLLTPNEFTVKHKLRLLESNLTYLRK